MKVTVFMYTTRGTTLTCCESGVPFRWSFSATCKAVIMILGFLDAYISRWGGCKTRVTR